MYKIIKITNLDGTPRLDGRYPLRIGCTGNYEYLKVDYPLLFVYDLDSNGNEKRGTLQTSTATCIKHEGKHIEVTTRNSIYILALI